MAIYNISAKTCNNPLQIPIQVFYDVVDIAWKREGFGKLGEKSAGNLLVTGN